MGLYLQVNTLLVIYSHGTIAFILINFTLFFLSSNKDKLPSRPNFIQPVPHQPLVPTAEKVVQSSGIKNNSSVSSSAESLVKLSGPKIAFKCRHCNFSGNQSSKLGRHLRQCHQSTFHQLQLQNNIVREIFPEGQNPSRRFMPKVEIQKDLSIDPNFEHIDSSKPQSNKIEDSSNLVDPLDEIDIKPNIVNGLLVLEEHCQNNQSCEPAPMFTDPLEINPEKVSNNPLENYPETLVNDPLDINPVTLSSNEMESTTQNWKLNLTPASETFAPASEPQKQICPKSRNKWSEHVKKTLDRIDSKMHTCSLCDFTSRRFIDVKRHTKVAHRRQTAKSQSVYPQIPQRLSAPTFEPTSESPDQNLIAEIKFEESDISEEDTVRKNKLQSDILSPAIETELNFPSSVSESLDRTKTLEQSDQMHVVFIQAQTNVNIKFQKIAPKPSNPTDLIKYTKPLNPTVSKPSKSKPKGQTLLKKCTECDFTTATFNDLKHHNETLHHGFKYKCSICDRSFVEKRSLLCHMITHKDVPLANVGPLNRKRKKNVEPTTDFGLFYKDNVLGVFVCKECNYTSHASNIRRHMRRYHTTPIEGQSHTKKNQNIAPGPPTF